MRGFLHLTTCSILAFAISGAAVRADDVPEPTAKPEMQELRNKAENYRKDTIAGRYKATMMGESLAESLLDEAFDGDDENLDGDHLIEAVLEPAQLDLPGIRDRGFMRLAIAPDPLMIAYDGERAIGVAIAIARELEKFLQKQPDASGTPTVVVPMPTPRARIPESLETGLSDFTALTITEKREDRFDFTQPMLTDVNDILVHSPEIGPIESIDDMVGTPIYVQEGGRYAQNLLELNARRSEQGKEPLTIKLMDERLDDYDLMEMVEVGLIPATVMSSFKAEFWSEVYTTAKVRQDMELTSDGRIAWAVRTDNPKLHKALNGFAGKVKKGTLLGNVILTRYLSSADWIENINTDDARGRIAEVEPVIRKYSQQFEFDPELVLAQAYQESKLDQSKRSHVGAIGVMQVMPKTAADPVVGIPDVSNLDNNVHAGVKYLRWLRDTWFDDPEISPLDQTLLAFAAYNAGPGGVKRARKRARKMGLDPDVWFENVEVAITRVVSREPAIYVRNIFKYYVSYRLMRELEAEREAAREEVAEVQEEVENLSLEERAEVLEEETDLVVDEVTVAEEQVGMGSEGDPADDAAESAETEASGGSEDDAEASTGEGGSDEKDAALETAVN